MARRALLDAALGLQIYDDVLDWETDATRGGAWALSLARSTLRAGPRGFGTTPAEQRAEVHASGVLARMLRRARYHFRSAARRAAALGAARVSAWAEERARALEDLAVRESRHAGYVNRAHTLAAWARAVFVTKA
ncbi:MAG: hypothetical protein R3F14_34150 [Polyangiaceae bacterium]